MQGRCLGLWLGPRLALSMAMENLKVVLKLAAQWFESEGRTGHLTGRKLSLFCLILVGFSATAMPVKSRLIKPRAFFQETDPSLLRPLDLMDKTATFRNKEVTECGSKLVRQALTLSYSCTFEIPSKAKISKLHGLLSSEKLEVFFGGSRRIVKVKLSEDARKVTFSTAFDSTGVDFELSKFNDDFFSVYDKVAQLVIGDAIKNYPVKFQVLEGR